MTMQIVWLLKLIQNEWDVKWLLGDFPVCFGPIILMSMYASTHSSPAFFDDKIDVVIIPGVRVHLRHVARTTSRQRSPRLLLARTACISTAN